MSRIYTYLSQFDSVLVVFHYSGIPPQCARGCYSNVGQKSRNVICMQNKQHNNGGHQNNGVPAAKLR